MHHATKVEEKTENAAEIIKQLHDKTEEVSKLKSVLAAAKELEAKRDIQFLNRVCELEELKVRIVAEVDSVIDANRLLK